ncbi:N-acetylmuramoyl-L-alanine amidase [Salirhabdus salicampi]|uniref:N-acetylmuramoyl-L-alanine amidase n=1 Tax=Salirhabdus salicampi TaxID=476102 RepID=UPI0020C32082|nr:N-acetylmuramoyl-L-alanine amidase [Salirhabdus salicampi]MCP8616975.1 N-acetylmuramoyl-L-alanine amidase [Salirhabdus salicampi]
MKHIFIFITVILLTLIPQINHIYANNGVIQVDGLNIRSGPGTDYSVIGQANSEQVFTVLEQTDGWVNISGNGLSGWVAAQYISVLEESDYRVAVSSTEVMVREQNTSTSDIVKQVTKGTALEVLKKSGSWYEVKLPTGETGWIASWHVTNGDNIEETIQVTFHSVPIRKSASNDDEIIGFGEKGDSYLVRNKTGQWYEIEYNDEIGYIHKHSVQNPLEKKENILPLQHKTIVIDPGHGGDDPGTFGVSGTAEKDVVLKTATLLQKKLHQLGATTILTRTDDRFISLNPRIGTAKLVNADLFISLHYNSAPEFPSARGIHTYYYYSQYKELAQYVQEELIKETSLRDRGALQESYFVIRENKQPSLLLELGFLSNATEEELVQSSTYQHQITDGITNGLVKYFRH